MYMSDFVKNLLNKYNDSPVEIMLANMRKIDESLNIDNVFVLAYMANCEAISPEERAIFTKLVELKIKENNSKPLRENEMEEIQLK